MVKANHPTCEVHLPAVILGHQSAQKRLQIHHGFILTRLGIGRERYQDTFPVT